MSVDLVQYLGSVTRQPEKRRWIVECEPHALRKLKRWFDGIPKDTPGDRAPIADSPSNCKDLLWFMAGMPLRVSAEDRAYLQDRAHVEKVREQSVTRVLTGAYTPTKFNVALEPWPFQYLPAELTLAAGGVLCADEVGLGKTLEASLLISDPRARPALVVCPAQIVAQWEERLKQYLPGIRVHTLRKRTPYPLTQGPRGKAEPMPDVVICTYAKLAGWSATLATFVKAVVYDEVHNLCHEWADPQKTRRVMKYEAAIYLRDHVPYRLGLSGTPIKNYGGEARVVMGVLLADSLGTEKEFGAAWCNGSGGEKAQVTDPKALGSQMARQGLMVCRSREDVGRYLPPVTVHVQPVECDMVALNKVKVDTIEFAKTLLRRGVDPDEKLNAAREIDWRLRHATGLAKAPAVIEFVKIVASRTPVLLLGWHHDFWRLMVKGLADLNPVFMNGQSSAAQKKQAVDLFLAGKSRVFCMSHRSGEGVDGLQKVCSTVVMGEFDWSYAQMMKQNVGRVQREGQASPVFVHVMLGDAGADPFMAAKLGIKREQLEGLIRPNAPDVEQVQTDPGHVKELARSWLAAQDPKALAAIEKEIRDADAAKVAEKEERKAARKGGRRSAPRQEPIPIDVASLYPVEPACAAPSPPPSPSLHGGVASSAPSASTPATSSSTGRTTQAACRVAAAGSSEPPPDPWAAALARRGRPAAPARPPARNVTVPHDDPLTPAPPSR